MEASQDLAAHSVVEPNTEEMRQEIDSTRSALADKVEALEDRVKGSVQTVEDSIQIAKETVETVRRTFDIERQVEQHPWIMVSSCFVAGLAFGNLLPTVLRRIRAVTPHANGSLRAAASPSAPQEVAAGRRGFFDLFHDEIAQVKGMAIGYIMGLARDSIKRSVPHLASEIESVMNGVATKLGATPQQAGAALEEK
jgi:ElaB/YqjD/DUF883 family membrane-anchored ribosome-binding protein